MEQVRLQKYECIFVHRLGFRRRVTVHAIDESVAERMAWAALTAARAWRPMWVVRVVLTDLANELCPECGWPLPPELARCRGCNYPDPIPAELSDRATPTKEDTR